MTNNISNTSYKIIVMAVRVFFNINLNNLISLKSNWFFLDVDWLLNFLILRLDVTCIRFFLIIEDKFPDNRFKRSFDNFNNSCFCRCPTQTVCWLLDNNGNSITINGMANVITTDEHVIFTVIDMQETKTVLIGTEDTFNSHLIRIFFLRTQGYRAISVKTQLSLTFHG